MLWRLILAVIVILILWWAVPAILSLFVLIAPPLAKAVEPIAIIIRAILAIWGIVYVLTGRGGPALP